MSPIDRKLYFAYGSNMNDEQMAFRCPDAEAVGTVRLEGYRLAFCGKGGRGVATILPEAGSHVDGVLWHISAADEKSLDRYEGYPFLYTKETLPVSCKDGSEVSVMAYVMTAPSRDIPAKPSPSYLNGILEGCRQRGVNGRPILDAAFQSTKAQFLAPAQKKQRGQER